MLCAPFVAGPAAGKGPTWSRSLIVKQCDTYGLHNVLNERSQSIRGKLYTSQGLVLAIRSRRGMGVTMATAKLEEEVKGLSGTKGLAPAVIPGTLPASPLPPNELIALAQKIFLEEDGGITNPSRLADDFRFEFPIVSLDKEAYIKAVSSFNLKNAFPDLATNAYDWRVDKYEPHRVWWTTRTTATHKGTLNFGGKVIEATGKEVYGAPEVLSYTFNDKGQVTSFTGGYVVDRRVGNTDGLGAVFGILAAIGHPLPKVGTLRWSISQLIARFFLFFRGKPKK